MNLTQVEYLRCRIDAELQFALFAVIDRQSLHQQRSETGSGSAAERVEHQETLSVDERIKCTFNRMCKSPRWDLIIVNFFQEQNLKSDTVFGQAADAIGDDVGNFAADGVVSAGVIVGRVLLARDQLVRMEQLAVGSSAHRVHHRRFQVDEQGARHFLAARCLAEEGAERGLRVRLFALRLRRT